MMERAIARDIDATSLKLLNASLLALAASLALTITAQAHSGRTNSQGCHAGTQPYHCHNDGDDDSSEYDSPSGSSGSSGQPINDRSGNVIILPGQGGQSGSQVPSDNNGTGTSRPVQPAITGSGYPFGYVRNVVDGDTLNALIGSESQTVRLACIDAPEAAQEPVGMLASNRLTAFLSPGRQFTYRSVDTDQYGRMVAEIYISGASLNVHLVKEGMAVVYPQYLSGCAESRSALLAAEAEARAARRGFWSQPNPVMPWNFRQQ